jgi:hypothetical protein
MKGTPLLFALILLTGISGCSAVTQEDLCELRSPNAIVKREAIARLAKERPFPLSLMDRLASRTNSKKAAVIMAELLRGREESKDVELAIIKALGTQGRRGIQFDASPLIERIKDEDRPIRRVAVEAVGKMKLREAVPMLIELLQGQGDTDKYPTIWALGEINAPESVPVLNQFLVSKDKYLRFNAYRALAKIGKASEEVEDKESNTGGLLGFGKRAFQKYQDMMAEVFYRISGRKKA